MTKTFLFLTLLFLSCFSTAKAELVVERIDIVVKKETPYQNIDKQAIVRKMKTKVGASFSQIDFDADLKTLATECDNIEPKLHFEGNKVFITLEIYPRLYIRNIIWKGNQRVKTSRLNRELDIKPGIFLDRHAFNEAFYKIRTYYIRKGFFEAELHYEILPDPCTNEVDIEIHIKEGTSGKIKQICITGVTECEERKILDLMATEEFCLITSWYTKGGTFHPEALEHDKLVITNFLQNEGYADASIEIAVSPADVKDRIIVHIKVNKGERYTFGKVTFSGNHIFSDEVVCKHLGLFDCSPFSPDRLREAAQRLTSYLGSKGYIEASVNFVPRLDPNKNSYDVHFEIEEGHLFKVGLVKVFGNVCTKRNVILHECLLIPGDVFDSRKLEGTECRLKKIGFFECVNVYPVKSMTETDGCEYYRDVHIEVKETSTGNFGVFAGFSSLDSLFGGIDIAERNFNIGGLLDIVRNGPSALRGNGEFLQGRTSIGLKSSSYLLRWTKPYFLDSKWIVGFDFEYATNKNLSSNYELITRAFKLHATYAINDYLRYGWHYRLQDSRISHLTSNDATAKNEEDKHGAVSALGPVIVYDSTDCPHKPSKGFRSEFNLEYAGLGGNFNFFSSAYLNSYYYPVSSRGTLKTRVDMQFLQPLGRTTYNLLPLGERYFLGGETTIRGYRGYSVGPQAIPGDPLGGISSFLVSEEYLHRLYKRIDAFAFFDGGSVSSKQYTIRNFRCSVGLGLRIEVMENTPIILGVGFPLNPSESWQVKRFFISFGGRF